MSLPRSAHNNGGAVVSAAPPSAFSAREAAPGDVLVRSLPQGLGEDGSPQGRDSGTLARFTTAVSAHVADRPQHQREVLSSMELQDRKKLHAIVQQEYTQIREKVPSKLAVLSSPKLLVLPEKFMARMGGAAAIYFWLCVSPTLLEAPKDVRQAVIAHEWGHIASGHCNATIGSLVGALLYVLISLATPPGSFWPLVNLVLLGLMFSAIFWALHGHRELEADEKAADAVGAANMAHGLRWIIDRMRNGEQTDLVKERLRRLDARAAAEAGAQAQAA